MVLTDDVELLKQLKGLARGMEGSLATRYRHPLSDLQAALGLSQLARYDEFLRRRRSIADFYFDQFRDLPVQLPHHVRNRSIFFRFPLRIQTEFSDVCALFNKEGIQVRRGVDTLLHRQLGGNAEDFPGAERCFAETLSIPLYPAMTDKECERVVSSCRLILGGMLDGSKAR
jgi:UDP-4-amino-4-deoxy-L-arabinose-oxoglutarate aminotransferase